MKPKLLPRVFITIIGISFILWGFMSIALGIIGESTLGVVTNIRREGGERADYKPGQYTYVISYTFTLPNGKEIYGFTKKISNGAYIKADGTGKILIKYSKAMPFINSPAEDSQFSISQIILIGVGVLLILLMNGKPKTAKTIE